MSKGVDYFDSHPNVAASKVYTLDKPMPPVKQRPRTSPEIKTPFVPSQLPKIGYNATLTPFPEYKESPYDSQLKKDREYSHEQKKKVIGGAYRPTSHPKSTPQAVRFPSTNSIPLYLKFIRAFDFDHRNGYAELGSFL
eukprot:TRINITY_DN1937_c0_g1_i2.p2 TRINITY_DN1937_c0_g1~~TRINITY_DN1937_c0_g1_i2.p2  ORF type:complete len:138 (+),score=23.75 TRINITY_DN1937_c0_g1_i2:638-1051(+)